MLDGQLIPGECDVREWVRVALEDYGVFLVAHAEAWPLMHAQWGVETPRARALDAEACIVSVGLFLNFYAGLSLRLAPMFADSPASSLTARLN
jgi:hypothetical protein